jgi:hypothetical protein
VMVSNISCLHQLLSCWPIIQVEQNVFS